MPKRVAPALLGCLFLLLAGLTPALAQDTYTVIPFNYFGPEKYQHYSKAIRAELSRKLRLAGKFEPVEEYTMDGQEITAPQSSSDTAMLLSRLGVDWLIFGDVTIAGDQATLVAKVGNDRGGAFTEEIQVPLNELSLEIETVAKTLQADIFPDLAAPQQGPATLGTAPQNPEILDAQTGTAADPAALVNPQFRYEGGSQSEGRWQSQGFRWPCRSMVVADGDGDGQNDIFILGDQTLHAMHYEQGKLVEDDSIDLSKRGEHLRINALDFDRDGAAEIILTSHRDDHADSTIFSWKNKHFSVVMEDIDYYLNVVNMPPNYTPVLLGQKRGTRTLLESDDVVEMLMTGGELVAGKRVMVPAYGNVFNIAYMPEDDKYKIVVNDEFSRLKVYDSNQDQIYETTDTYNSSAIPLPLPKVLVYGMGETTRPTAAMDEYYYVPIPMQVTDIMQKGKYELLVNKDVSVAMTIFYKFRTFVQGELHSMFWDGTGLTLAWKTRRIKGTVVDYEIADITNDGRPELVVLLNTYPGAMALEHRKTVIIAYDLNQ